MLRRGRFFRPDPASGRRQGSDTQKCQKWTLILRVWKQSSKWPKVRICDRQVATWSTPEFRALSRPSSKLERSWASTWLARPLVSIRRLVERSPSIYERWWDAFLFYKLRATDEGRMISLTMNENLSYSVWFLRYRMNELCCLRSWADEKTTRLHRQLMSTSQKLPLRCRDPPRTVCRSSRWYVDDIMITSCTSSATPHSLRSLVT